MRILERITKALVCLLFVPVALIIVTVMSGIVGLAAVMCFFLVIVVIILLPLLALINPDMVELEYNDGNEKELSKSQKRRLKIQNKE